jgi:hypothetical protein
MAKALGWAVPIACVAYLVLQVVALKQLSGQRLSNATGGLVVAVLAAFCLLDWLVGLTGWALFEGYLMIGLAPITALYLVVLLIQESREQSR